MIFVASAARSRGIELTATALRSNHELRRAALHAPARQRKEFMRGTRAARESALQKHPARGTFLQTGDPCQRLSRGAARRYTSRPVGNVFFRDCEHFSDFGSSHG